MARRRICDFFFLLREISATLNGMRQKSNPFVAKVDVSIANRLKKELEGHGFTLSTPPYTCFSAKKPGVSCTLYQSGKLVVQGKEKDRFIEFFLEPEVLGCFDYRYSRPTVDTTPRIGIDESGKGDLFGPLCIAGLYAKDDAIAELEALGVRDSKDMHDNTIQTVAAKLKKSYHHQIVRINPAKYNTLYTQFRNLNKMLAWGHATAIEALATKTQCHNVIVDQFAAEHVVETALKKKGVAVTLTQRTRAEEDLVVAGASILARDAFLSGIRKLEEEFSITLPKGASKKTVAAAHLFVKKWGREALEYIAKLHFKSLDGIRE